MPMGLTTRQKDTHFGKQPKTWNATFYVYKRCILHLRLPLLVQINTSLIYTHTLFHLKKRVPIKVKNMVTFQLKQITLDPNGWYIILVCTINKVDYTLVNIYAPTVHQMQFFHRLMWIVKPMQQGHLIICGDFNIVPEVQIDSTSAEKRRESPLKNVLFTHDLFDIWHCHHGSERDYTYFSSPH